METQDLLLTVEEVACRLRVNVVTVRRKIASGQLRAFRTNGDSGPYRVTGEALSQYMSEGSKMVEVAVQ